MKMRNKEFCNKCRKEILPRLLPRFDLKRKICYDCRDLLVAKAKEEGKCITCFVKPRSKLMTQAGTPSEDCKACGVLWTRLQ